jgi:predicted GNAT family acetyltransferase
LSEPVRDNRDRQRFEILLDDGDVAFAEYKRLGHAILFPQTVVPPAHEGQGLGSSLVKAALAAAREERLKVMPQCAFFASYMKRHPDTHDLLDPSYARLLGVD